MTQTFNKINLWALILIVSAGAVAAFLSFDNAGAVAYESRSKTAYNVTQGRDAESVDAKERDTIEYRLRYHNLSGSSVNVTIEDNISDVLRLADFVSTGGGEKVGDYVRFPSVTVSDGQSVERTFRVRVKAETEIDHLSDLTMENSYGNSVFVRVDIDGINNNDGDGIKEKFAYNQTQGIDAEETIADAGDLIEYRLRYYNDSNRNRTITIEDNLDDVLELATVTSLGGGALDGKTLRFPTETVAPYRTVEKKFQILVKDLNYRLDDMVMTNHYGNTVSIRVEDDTEDFSRTLGSDTHSKQAYNRTQGRDAESALAHPGDIIEYTLTYRNNTSNNQTITIEDDIRDVLDLAEVTDFGGGQLDGNYIRFNSVYVPQGSRVSKTFHVRVKDVPSSKRDLMMSNFYGNGVDIEVLPTGAVAPAVYIPPKGQPQVLGQTYVSPATGPKENFALIFSLLLTGGWFVYNKRAKLKAVVS